MCIARRPIIWLTLFALLAMTPPARAADGVTADQVLRGIERGTKYLIASQNRNGSWTAESSDRFRVGVTSLTLLALINSGLTIDDPAVRKGLEFLRSVKVNEEPEYIYEVSLMVMALAAAKDGERDVPRMLTLTKRLEEGQIKPGGGNVGMWSYTAGGGAFQGGGDNSNTQYAILGLKEASDAGIPVDPAVWERARDHWRNTQNLDNGWGYSGGHNPSSTGSMTVAGIASLVICNSMIRDDRNVTPDGRPICCNDEAPDPAIEKGLEWMRRHFSVATNPGSRQWVLYYIYGLERAGRLSGQRFFGTKAIANGQEAEIDWYREGAEFLIAHQNGRGYWMGVGGSERDPIIGTSFALLFLSKGLAPVLINKLDYSHTGRGLAAVPDHNWNQHPSDVRNLTDFVSGLEKWPKLVTWQTLQLERVQRYGSVQDLRQAPVLYLSGAEQPRFTQEQADLLKEYLDQGGFIFAVRNCNSVGFREGIEDLVGKMFPNGEAELKRLGADHVVFRSHYPLDAATTELWGVDLGCRTAMMFAPDDLSCYWDKWMRHADHNRHPQLAAGVDRAMKVGVNVVAYATGREPPIKLKIDAIATDDGRQDQIERGLLQIAKLRHSGGWDTAPHALRNLLIALNQTAGLAASTTARDLPPGDMNLFKYPIVYMHGRGQFSLEQSERERLRTYLENGGVLFADACCGDKKFDAAFRAMMTELFPDRTLERIAADHELITGMDGYANNIRTVKRRMPENDRPGATLELKAQDVEPYLEGIKLGERYAVIYSKYDISCALERQASVACAGYTPEDALKIAVNIVIYAMLQDVTYSESVHGGQ